MSGNNRSGGLGDGSVSSPEPGGQEVTGDLRTRVRADLTDPERQRERRVPRPTSEPKGIDDRRAGLEGSNGGTKLEKQPNSYLLYPPQLRGRLFFIDTKSGRTVETIAEQEALRIAVNARNLFTGGFNLGDAKGQDTVRGITEDLSESIPQVLSGFARSLGREISVSSGNNGYNGANDKDGLAARATLRDLALLSEALENMHNAANIHLKTVAGLGEDITASIPSPKGSKVRTLADVVVASPMSVQERTGISGGLAQRDTVKEPGIYIKAGDSVFSITQEYSSRGEPTVIVRFGPLERTVLKLEGADPVKDFAIFEAGVVKALCARTMATVRDETIAEAMNIPIPKRVEAQSNQLWNRHEKEAEAERRRVEVGEKLFDAEKRLAPPAVGQPDLVPSGYDTGSGLGRKKPFIQAEIGRAEMNEVLPGVLEEGMEIREREKSAKSREASLRHRGPTKDLSYEEPRGSGLRKRRIERKAPPIDDSDMRSPFNGKIPAKKAENRQNLDGSLERAIYEKLLLQNGLDELRTTMDETKALRAEVGRIKKQLDKLSTTLGQMLIRGSLEDREAARSKYYSALKQADDDVHIKQEEDVRKKELAGRRTRSPRAYGVNTRGPEYDRFGPSRGSRRIRPSTYK